MSAVLNVGNSCVRMYDGRILSKNLGILVKNGLRIQTKAFLQQLFAQLLVASLPRKNNAVVILTFARLNLLFSQKEDFKLDIHASTCGTVLPAGEWLGMMR